MSFHGPTRALRQCLPGGYLAEVQGKVWEEFVGRVVDLLVEAAGKIEREEPGFEDRRDGTWWCDASREARGIEVIIALEDSVTDGLRRGVERLRKELPQGDFIRLNQIYVAEQQPRETQHHRGPKALTTDLQFASLELDYLDLRIEAKPIFEGKDVTQYCGKKGLLRFAEDEPYTEQAVGMMMGYIFRHDGEYWLRRIARVASHRHGIDTFETATVAGQPLKTCTITWAGNDVRVVHLMLPFTGKPCPPPAAPGPPGAARPPRRAKTRAARQSVSSRQRSVQPSVERGNQRVKQATMMLSGFSQTDTE